MRRNLSATALLTIPMLATAGARGRSRDGRDAPPTGLRVRRHQAAPGQDPKGLRPGKGTGDENHKHTAPPGQAPAGGGDPSGPMRGCKDDPRG